jgi:hypothetical protein
MNFLTNFGTRFTAAPAPNYDPREVCNLYAKMQSRMLSYMKQAGVLARLRGRRYGIS